MGSFIIRTCRPTTSVLPQSLPGAPPVLLRALQPLPEHEELPQDLAVMGEPASSNAGLAKELHADLVRKYKKHETAIETAWRSFDTA